jgi:hypothetical protein
MTTLYDRIQAAYPDAQPLIDFDLRDDGHGIYLAAWRIAGPLPEGVVMGESAIQEYERRYREILKAVETSVAGKVQPLEVLRVVNGLDAQIAATADGAVVGDSTLTKAEALAAVALLAAWQTWAATPLGPGLPSPLAIVFKRQG